MKISAILRLVATVTIVVASALSSPADAHALDEPSCISGGPGASACSYEVIGAGCSVTCSSGYACCGSVPDIGCKCIGGQPDM